MKKFNETFIRITEDLIPGGKGDGKSAKDIVEKFKDLFPNLTAADIADQMLKGLKVEKEHTTDKSKAREISMDHLMEHPLYYNFHEDAERKMDLDLKTREKKYKEKDQDDQEND